MLIGVRFQLFSKLLAGHLQCTLDDDSVGCILVPHGLLGKWADTISLKGHTHTPSKVTARQRERGAAILSIRASHEGGGRNPKAFAERPNLANIELPLARQDFRNHALTANLVQIALFDAVLFHQKS